MQGLQPFMLIHRLNECRDKVLQGLHSNNTQLVRYGVEGLATLIGHCILEFGSAEDPTLYQKGMKALLDAKDAMRQGDDHLKKASFSARVDNTRPSEWLSFDGEIKTPLRTGRSSIPLAGDGLFCNTPIKKGQVIAPCRIKIQDCGDFLLDWVKFPVAAMVNHHPLPNVSIVRGERPVGLDHLDPRGTETTYLVANQDIPLGEELTADYRDKGWAEWDYFDQLPLPLDQWDRNILRSLPESNNKLKSIVVNDPHQFRPSLELVGGSALCVLATRSSGLVSVLSGLAGISLAAHSVWKATENKNGQ